MLTIVFTCILFSSSVASAQIRTVLVSPVPGDPTASGTNLRNALANIPSPSSTNRWLLKIEPGIYQLQGTALLMRPWVDIEGSGIGVTTIRLSSPTDPFNSTISGASNAELRLLTVEATENVTAMSNNNAHPRIYRVKFVATGLARRFGMENILSAPRIEECEFIVSLPPSAFGPTFGFGISFDQLPTGVRSSILRSRIMVSGGNINYGVRMSRGQTVTEIQETRIDVTGGSSSNAYGIYAQGGDWLGSETLELRNVRIKSTSTSQSVGIFLEVGTSIKLEISHSTIEGNGASTAKGIFQGGNRAVGLQHSIVAGSTKTVEVPNHSFSIQATGLFGGPATAGLWNGCMGVWDENGTFYTNTGCPQ
jgi:hypothetical protein